MTFGDQLNAFIKQLGCTAKELSDASGLSPSVISRYRSGTRTPEADSENLNRITAGIAQLAEEKGVDSLTRESVARALADTLAQPAFPYEAMQKNLNILFTALAVNVSDLSHSLKYDTSFISRIRNGQRRPADPKYFAEEIARYIARRYTDPHERELTAQLMGCSPEELYDDSVCTERLTAFLTNSGDSRGDLVLPFLTRVDEFDLNEFIRSIRFDQLKVPTMPFQLPVSKTYFGLEEMRQGELDFFKSAVLSKSREPLIMLDDTPMADKTAGTDFMQKFIFAVALALKKGLHIHIVHNVNRPFEEMMMGLEGWIPMYMTGQISPYYLKGVHNAVFGHLLFSGGAAALSGECVMGFHENGMFYLTKRKSEVEYYRKRSENLLSRASPLMEIFRSDSLKQFSAFLQTDAETPGSRRSILSALPLYTMSRSLLDRILERNHLPEQERAQIRGYAARQRDRLEAILARDQVTDEIPIVTAEEFAEFPMLLPLSGLFLEKDVFYTYEDYLEHAAQTEAYAAAHPNYTLNRSGGHAFRNIQIAIHEGKWALISKNKAPAIHFAIRHPKLLAAIESFVSPLQGAPKPQPMK